MTDYIKNWFKKLKIKQKNDYTYTYFDYDINFNESIYGGNRRDYIDIYEKDSNKIIQSYKKISIGYHSLPVDLKYSTWDELLVETLIKIIADLPTIEWKKNNLYHIQEIQNKTYFDFDGESLIIDKFYVHKYSILTNSCIRYRPGKDDKYSFTLETSWFALFNNTIIQSNYIKSLLPEKLSKTWTEEIFGPTPVTEINFELDLKETEVFRKNFNLKDIKI